MTVRLAVLIAVIAGSAGLAGGARAADSGAPDDGFLGACGALHALEPGGALVARPTPPLALFSPHFVVHYATESVEDYARDVSESAELVYRVLVDTLQHLPPPSDGAGGGDARIDIYIRPATELHGAYGTTIPETAVGTPFVNSWTSWIEVADTLSAARRATVTVHEVYHVVQLGYDRLEGLTLLEMFSTWIEERTYDHYNSHYIWLLNFFRRPDRGIFEQHYTNIPWAIFLTQRHGDGIMRETLVRCGQTPGPNPRGAFDGALQSTAGVTLVEEFVEFGTWNYFTSLRDDGEHYEEGANYPGMRCQLRTTCYPVDRESDHSPSELAANYFLLDGNGHRGRMHVRVDPDPAASAFLTTIRFRDGGRERSVKYYAPGATPDSFVVDTWERCDSLLLIYQVERGHPTDNSITVRARYEFDSQPAEPWVLVLDRDGCRRPFDGDADQFRVRDGEETPIARALKDAGANAVVTDSLPADLSRCSSVFVVGGFGDDGVTLSPFDMATLTNYMNAGGDVYLESARLGAWVDSALAVNEPELPALWSMFGCAFQAGEDSANVVSWSTEGDVGGYSFDYDPGDPDHRVGILHPEDCLVLARDDRGHVRATVRRVGESTRVVSTVLLGGSTGRFGSTREAFVADVLSMLEGGTVAKPPPAALRLVASYPNPAREVAELVVDAPSSGPASVTVYDVAGRRVSSSSAQLVAGSNTVRLVTPRASGVYFVVIEAGGVAARGRFLVLR